MNPCINIMETPENTQIFITLPHLHPILLFAPLLNPRRREKKKKRKDSTITIPMY